MVQILIASLCNLISSMRLLQFFAKKQIAEFQNVERDIVEKRPFLEIVERQIVDFLFCRDV
jgi:hypothetical protein